MEIEPNVLLGDPILWICQGITDSSSLVCNWNTGFGWICQLLLGRAIRFCFFKSLCFQELGSSSASESATESREGGFSTVPLEALVPSASWTMVGLVAFRHHVLFWIGFLWCGHNKLTNSRTFLENVSLQRQLNSISHTYTHNPVIVLF